MLRDSKQRMQMTRRNTAKRLPCPVSASRINRSRQVSQDQPAGQAANASPTQPENKWLVQMQADAVLPDDIQAAGDNARPNLHIDNPDTDTKRAENTSALITGATGFLGRYVVKALLQQTTLRLVCLIRAGNVEQAWQRLFHALALSTIERTETAVKQRISVICGNLEQDNLGLDIATYQQLAQDTGQIFHCAALVNWARSYRKLRHINVLGTVRMIRFACHLRNKPLLFVSSLAVCFATNRQTLVNEQTDMLPHLADMPLGYAQSKCVAESLLRQAAQRGLPVTILRPALISGDTQSGVSNTEDFVAALLEGNTRLGLAMDTDWLLDFVAVDVVAAVVTRLALVNTATACTARRVDISTELMAEAVEQPAASGNAIVLHLMAEPPRYWRELILWLNLYGYPIRLVSVEDWLAMAFMDRQRVGDRLYAYRRFFQGLPSKAAGQARPFECYLRHNQQLIDSSYSRQWLQKIGLDAEALNAGLLQRYLTYFQREGLLPVPPATMKRLRHEQPDYDVLLRVLQRDNKLSSIQLEDLVPLAADLENGILHQLAAAYGGAGVGLHAYRLPARADSVITEIMVKTKCNAELVRDSMVQMAVLCSPRLGELLARFWDQLGLCQAERREAALYELAEPKLRQHSPYCYGTYHNLHTGLTTIVSEKLAEAETEDMSRHLDGWTTAAVSTVIAGLAQIQSVAMATLTPLLDKGLLAQERSTPTMFAMMPLWYELTAFASGQSEQAAQLLPLQQGFIDSLGEWWPDLLAQPQGLVHNDFNPRNLVLRNLSADGNQEQLQLCAFDWELAAIGVPQRDLAEFLCFVLNTEMRQPELVYRLIDEHRRHYVALTGREIDVESWRLGFELALRQFVLTRLPMYALMNRFRAQGFLVKLHDNAFWLLSVKR